MEHSYGRLFSWIMRNIEVYLQPPIFSYEIREMIIVIPGTQIPKWFNKQNASDSISVDPSAVMDDPNWIGIAICVLFVTHENPMNLGEGYHDYDFITIAYGVNNVYLWAKIYSEVDILSKKDLVTVELDHLFTVFYSREEFIRLLRRHPNTMHDLHGVEFGIKFSCQGFRVVVKNCGYRWVFKEDLQRLNSNMFLGRNSSSLKTRLLISD
ncbi:hypothetical protein VNO80_25504 [Phaseolus coccineus]|uniref:C-JID domain-containing protein n=1 Tax=Phaseolus coccineus TaxID=3886 RepID=A0AAN9LXZ1_PHACN